MSAHTPGPWHWINSITDEPFDFSDPWDGEGYPSLRTVATFGENKTVVRDGKSYTTFALPEFILDAEPFAADAATNAANARLIAAAPELLVALEAAESAMSHPVHAFEVLAEHSVVREMIRAAIAKATGAT